MAGRSAREWDALWRTNISLAVSPLQFRVIPVFITLIPVMLAPCILYECLNFFGNSFQAAYAAVGRRGLHHKSSTLYAGTNFLIIPFSERLPTNTPARSSCIIPRSRRFICTLSAPFR